MSRVIEELGKVFKRVVTLEEWLYQFLDASKLESVKLCSVESHQRLLKSTLVGYDHDHDGHVSLSVSNFLRSQTGKVLQVRNLRHEELIAKVIEDLMAKAGRNRSTNVFCYGYYNSEDSTKSQSSIISKYANSCTTMIQDQVAWYLLHEQIGNAMMYFLLSETSLFIHLQNSNYLQITGPDVQQHQILWPAKWISSYSHKPSPGPCLHSMSPCDIKFQKFRVLYAQPFLDSTQSVTFGFSPQYCLNSFGTPDDMSVVRKILTIMFPEQHGYAYNDPLSIRRIVSPKRYWARTPKRLKGTATDLVKSLINRHHKVPYRLLLDHCCPRDTDTPVSSYSVSRFCKLVVLRVFPAAFWGSRHNLTIIKTAIDRFIALRRYECITVQDIMDRFKIKEIPWLQGGAQPSSVGVKISRSDFEKRKQLLVEFIYWLVDQFLIPLIRSHFYVTEVGGSEVNRLVYYRQDTWRALSISAIESFKENNLVAISKRSAASQQSIDYSKTVLGVSGIRLVPKQTGGFRVITCLGRKHIEIRRLPTGKLFKQILLSINAKLKPIHQILLYEQQRLFNSEGKSNMFSSIRSASELHSRLLHFKQRFVKYNGSFSALPKLYFAKVDIEKCYDTIPSDIAERLALDLLRQDSYFMHKLRSLDLTHTSKNIYPRVHFCPRGRMDPGSVEDIARSLAQNVANRIYVDKTVGFNHSQKRIEKLISSHLTNGLIQIGRDLYKQRGGIPQGSVLSSFLCNLVYDILDQECLSFVRNDQSIMLRYVDDFLLITTDRQCALRFLKTMHEGCRKYGAFAKPEKSMINFRIDSNTDIPGHLQVKQLIGTKIMPYIGVGINVDKLDLVSIDSPNQHNPLVRIADSFTLPSPGSKNSAMQFTHKILVFIKMRLTRPMVDLALNSVASVLANIEKVCKDVGLRLYLGSKLCFKPNMPISAQFLYELILRQIAVIIAIVNRVNKGQRESERPIYDNAIRSVCIKALRSLLEKKNSGVMAKVSRMLN